MLREARRVPEEAVCTRQGLRSAVPVLASARRFPVLMRSPDSSGTPGGPQARAAAAGRQSGARGLVRGAACPGQLGSRL